MEPSSPQHSHVISQQVYGSSRKLQFIGISPMDSLLTAIDHQTQPLKSTTHQTMSIESLLDSNGDTPNKRRYPSEDIEHQKLTRRKTNSDTSPSNIEAAPTNATINSKPTTVIIAKTDTLENDKTTTSAIPRMTLTCYHASVAQKSYGSEKRFLCPPPVVRVQSPTSCAAANASSSSSCQLTMAVISENGDTPPLEQHAILDDDDECSFKYLHVTGTAKAKQFSLRIDVNGGNDIHTSPLSTSSSNYSASFVSNPISIISKPSKKTSKARNVSTCILATQPVSLFNRINSQTVRTKYMTSENNHLCAKNGSWTPFDITILSIPHQYQSTQRPQPTSNGIRNNKTVVPLIYGSELILKDTRTGVFSQPLIIRKVDKGRIVTGAYGPVSQMQKIALQLVRPLLPAMSSSQTTPLSHYPHQPPLYLSAMGTTDGSEPGVLPAHSPHTTLLDFGRSRMIPEGLDVYEKVDDYLCWTIVGISTFEHTFYEKPAAERVETAATSSSSSVASSPLSSPLSSLSSISSHRLDKNETRSSSPSSSITTSSSRPSPPARNTTTLFPTLSTIQYQAATHTLDIVGQHLMQAAPSPKLLELWLGSQHGPLHTTIQPQPIQPHQTHLQVALPSVQDLIVANHDRLITRDDADTRTMELPLFFVREDGVVYHSGKALVCDMLVNSDAGRWSIVDVRQ